MLNKDTRVLLLDAIDATRRPGRCAYVDENGPVCVVGQFAVRVGVPVDELRHWHTLRIDHIARDYRVPAALTENVELLQRLQTYWDGADDREDLHKAALRLLVAAG